MIFAEHMESFYRVIDDPNPEADFGTAEGYETLRRAMVVLNTDTIFGPLSYNDDQRNVGRGAAGTQWQPQTVDGNTTYRNVLVSPFLEAEADSKIPAPSAVNCTAGSYVNETLVLHEESILGNKCEVCPVDTYTATSNQLLQCHVCPVGSTTGGLTGQAHCVQENDNLLSAGTLSFGYLAASITWILSLGFIGWLIKNKSHPVVQLSQFEYMIMICIGAILSSSTIIALSIQAGSDEDTSVATRACQAAPFLYTIGWVLQYGSLTAKSFRLAKIMNNRIGLRVTVTAYDTMYLVAGVLALDLIVVITWTATYPLEVSCSIEVSLFHRLVY
jgi:7 transmembrane sweet-taste receptor of 3 GCPR